MATFVRRKNRVGPVIDVQKEQTLHAEVVEKDLAALEANADIDPAELKKVLRRVDFRVLPVLTFIYLMSYLDRGNIGNTRVAGLTSTLGLTDQQYNMCLTIFFFPYALFEVPSNIVLKILKPIVWLPIIVITWGTVMTLMGIVQNYAGLLAARFFLGLAEAGTFPAATYILTSWYCRYELQTRLAVFYTAASFAGAFSGLLAFAIEKMEGIAGLEGWRWIFIIEGMLTVALGITLPFILCSSPEKAGFLSEGEKAFLIQRLSTDSKIAAKDRDVFKWKYLKQALTDWKIYLSVLVFWGNTIPGYGFVFSLPAAIKGLGYSAAEAQLLTIPIYMLAVIVVLISSWYGDKWKTRSSVILYPFKLCAVAFIILMTLPKEKWPGARYGMLFLVAAGFYPSLCGVIAWNANNLAGNWKRNIGMALQLTVGNLGGAIGSNIYLARESPHYWTGYSISLAVLLTAIVSGWILRFSLQRINHQREKMTPEEIHSKYTEEQLQEMGDRSPLFRYTL
ncbi:hypothetical protein CLAIMM_09807 [Cladophialophora immunda]|nr:hypothetical protein CLAIMM_09807 [Cladophialophora immunda]